MKPTVLQIGPYRFSFFSHEPNEPPPVHVDRDNSTAKFWHSPVRLAREIGFSAKEMREIQRLVVDNEQTILEAWNGYFGDER